MKMLYYMAKVVLFKRVLRGVVAGGDFFCLCIWGKRGDIVYPDVHLYSARWVLDLVATSRFRVVVPFQRCAATIVSIDGMADVSRCTCFYGSRILRS
jgi:hypothetical protein